MAGINTGKVITGGLVAGVVFSVLDALNGMFIVGEDFKANATRLGLDPAIAESTSAMATWVVIDLLFGILVVLTYAAIRQRFGPGPKTAIYAGRIPYVGITLIVFGLSQGGLMPTALWLKMAVISLVITSVGAVAGAMMYKEA